MSDEASIPEGAEMVSNPLILMHLVKGTVETRIHPPFDYTHKHYGLLVCDLVRHIAAMFRVDESKVWYWVERERQRPTDQARTIKHAFPMKQ